MTPAVSVSLREAGWTDVSALFEFQRDPEGNALAGTKPRDREAFEAVWRKMLADPPMRPTTSVSPRIPPRVIVADGELVGSINVFIEGGEEGDGTYSIGYWIAREHWGRGIATRAIGLMLEELPSLAPSSRCRPLHAQVASHNTASRRALERNGFVFTKREQCGETDRYTAAEVLTLVLA